MVSKLIRYNYYNLLLFTHQIIHGYSFLDRPHVCVGLYNFIGISFVPSFDVKQSVANRELPEHYTKQNDHNDNNMAIRITLKTIDYYKFRKMVVDGNRDDYAVCSKDVRTLCDSVQTILFRDEEFDDVSDRMRFDEICKYVCH